MKKTKNNPVATADVIAFYGGKIVLIERQKKPFGLALPGGHVENGETPKEAAVREFTEETGLILRDVRFFIERKGCKRDMRYSMTKTRVYTGVASGKMRNEEGFTRVLLVGAEEAVKLPGERFAFDHGDIVRKFLSER
jgi:ADP-ribose pyrophosphatase YjhB (NUDIX family)